MKMMYIVFSKIKNTLKLNKFISIILFVGIFACNIMFIYAYGIVVQANMGGISGSYIISYQSGEQIDIFDIEEQLKNYNVHIEYYASLDVFYNEKHLGEAIIRTRSDYEEFFFADTGEISNLSRLNTVMIARDFNDYLSIGDTIKINDAELEIAGKILTEEFIVSMNTFHENWKFPDVITVNLFTTGTRYFMSILTSLFHEGYLIEHNPTTLFHENDRFSFFILVIIYILCILSLLFFMAHIYNESAYELNVYEILGSSRHKIIAIISLEMFIIISLNSILSTLFHRISYNSIFRHLNRYDGFAYTLRDYAFIFIFTLIIVSIFVLLYILVRMRKSLIINSRKFIG